jgi:hypothetical protein
VRIPGAEFPGNPLRAVLREPGDKTQALKGQPAAVRFTPPPLADPVPDGLPKGSGGFSPSLSPSLLSLLSRLKLPPDGFSAAIVSFAKFFSLPLNPALLSGVRRQGFSGGNSDPAFREARALACLAALDKGVELSGESLDRYARLISGSSSPEPAEPGRDAGEDRGEAGGSGNFQAGTGSGQGSAGGSSGGSGQGGGNRGRNQSGSQDLRKLAREAEAKEPLLDFLNRIPGRNGKRWLVIPIPLEDGEARLVTLRLLLSPSSGISGAPAGSPGEVEQMALEINGAGRRWFFNFRPGSVLRAALWPEPGERERAALERELAAALGLAPGQVQVGGPPVFAPDCRNDLFSLREEV